METGHPSTRAVNSGRQLGLWKPGFTPLDDSFDTRPNLFPLMYSSTVGLHMSTQQSHQSRVNSIDAIFNYIILEDYRTKEDSYSAISWTEPINAIIQ